jgi:hypothetical protein
MCILKQIMIFVNNFPLYWLKPKFEIHFSKTKSSNRSNTVMYLVFDTELLDYQTMGPITDSANWPRCIQIAWQLHDAMGNLIEHQDYLVKPEV